MASVGPAPWTAASTSSTTTTPSSVLIRSTKNGGGGPGKPATSPAFPLVGNEPSSCTMRVAVDPRLLVAMRGSVRGHQDYIKSVGLGRGRHRARVRRHEPTTESP